MDELIANQRNLGIKAEESKSNEPPPCEFDENGDYDGDNNLYPYFN